MKFNYEDLDVAKLSRRLISDVYQLSEYFPSKENFGLTSQMRREAVSVLLNIAEGDNRKTKKDYSHFITISTGSLVELDCALKISIDLKYLSNERYLRLEPTIKELYFKLIGLAKYLRK